MKKIFAILFLMTCSLITNAQIITTIAGTGTAGFSGDGGSATVAKIGYPDGCAFDANGNFYFTTVGNDRVRKVAPNGIISTIAGTGISGYNGDNIIATAAELNGPFGIAVDKYNNIYIADALNNRVRKVDVLTGIISTVAGTGASGFSGDGGLATAATLNGVEDICFDKIGNFYIADDGNFRIRKIDTLGIISTFAGNGIGGYSGDGGAATTAEFGAIGGVCADANNNLYITDFGNHRVRVVTAAGIITTIAGNGLSSGPVGDGGPATDASLCMIRLAIDKIGNIYVSGFGCNSIRKVDNNGIIYTVVGNNIAGFSGDGGPATCAELSTTYGITFDTCGNLYIADKDNVRIRKVTFDSTCGSNSDTTNAVQNIKNGGFSVYPNPTSKDLTLTLSINGEGITVGEGVNSVVLYNMLGQVVYDKTFVQQKKVTIDISLLPDGVYFIKVNGIGVDKVLKE